MKFGYFCNTTNWNHKPYDQLLNETQEITTYCDENNCSKNLNQNGRLIITTMNMDSFFAKITGKYYPWIIPMHKFYFTNYSMKKYLEKNNFQLDKTVNDVRVVSLDYLFLKLSHKISIFKYLHRFIIKFNFLKNFKIKFSLFDINIYCASLKG